MLSSLFCLFSRPAQLVVKIGKLLQKSLVHLHCNKHLLHILNFRYVASQTPFPVRRLVSPSKGHTSTFFDVSESSQSVLHSKGWDVIFFSKNHDKQVSDLDLQSVFSQSVPSLRIFLVLRVYYSLAYVLLQFLFLSFFWCKLLNANINIRFDNDRGSDNRAWIGADAEVTA